MVSRGRAEHYSSHPLMAGIPSIYIQRIAVRILDARRFAKILLVADLLGRIPIHQHPTILTGEPLRVTQSPSFSKLAHERSFKIHSGCYPDWVACEQPGQQASLGAAGENRRPSA